MDHISRSNARAREKDLNTYSKSKNSNESQSNPKSTVDPIRLPFSGNLIGLRESESDTLTFLWFIFHFYLDMYALSAAVAFVL